MEENIRKVAEATAKSEMFVDDVDHWINEIREAKISSPIPKFETIDNLKKRHPDIFDSKAKMDEIWRNPKRGDNLKVRTGGETFWATILDVEGCAVKMKISNMLICVDEHGLIHGDIIVADARENMSGRNGDRIFVLTDD